MLLGKSTQSCHHPKLGLFIEADIQMIFKIYLNVSYSGGSDTGGSDSPIVIALNIIMARPVMNTGTKYRAPVWKTHFFLQEKKMKNHWPHI